MSNEYDQIFAGIARAKPVSQFASRLPVGRHTVVLSRFGIKKSQQALGNIMEADFVVAESDSFDANFKAGAERGWAWFIESQGWAGAYEQSRAKQFLEAIAACTNDKTELGKLGAKIAGPSQQARGLMLEVIVSLQTNKDGTAKLSKKQTPMTNAIWRAIAQSQAEIKASRDQLDDLDGESVDVEQASVEPEIPDAVFESVPAEALAASTATAGSGRAALAALRKR